MRNKNGTILEMSLFLEAVIIIKHDIRSYLSHKSCISLKAIKR